MSRAKAARAIKADRDGRPCGAAAHPPHWIKPTRLKMIDNQISKRVRIIQRVYIGLACFAILAFISEITQTSRSISPEYAGNSLIFAFINIAVYIGLKKQRNWIIPLILITTILVLVQTLFAIIEPVFNLTAFMAKLVQFFILFFYWYQAFFFTRQDVKQYFGSKGTIMF
jgi:hypothetical protein